MAKKIDQLREFARLGAALRREQLVAEIGAIDKAFPGLTVQKRTGAPAKTNGLVTSAPAVKTVDEPAVRRARKRRKLTAAEKRLISQRMKKYWANRKRKGH